MAISSRNGTCGENVRQEKASNKCHRKNPCVRQERAPTKHLSSALRKHYYIYNLLIEKWSLDNSYCSWSSLSLQKLTSGLESGRRTQTCRGSDKKKTECCMNGFVENSSTARRSFHLLFVSILTATNVVLSILCLIRNACQTSDAYILCVIFESDCECVIYTLESFRRIVFCLIQI